MKVLLAALTAVLLLSITSVTYAHGSGHKKERVTSRYDTPVSVRLLFGSGWGSVYGMPQHDQRYRGKPAFMRSWPFWKKVRYMQKMNYRYRRHDRRDRHGRGGRHRHDRYWHDRHDIGRQDRYDGPYWYDKYFK